MHNYSIILFIFAALLHKYTSMSTKKERLDAICRIIQTEEELLKQLENSGFQVTQATLSRDIKQLKVIKVHDGDGNYVYRLPDYSALMQPVKEQTQYHPNIEFSGNLAVVKTRPGYAMGIASDIDTHALRNTGHDCRRRHDPDHPARRDQPGQDRKSIGSFYIIYIMYRELIICSH